jgi:hypothetical protein
MEDFKKKATPEMMDKEIVFSKSVKAGKRIYYLDVKKNRKDEMFLTITESKKIVSGEGENPQINFEKHKIFLYQEDFEKFINGLTQAIGYINSNQELHYYGMENKEEQHSSEGEKADCSTSSDKDGMENESSNVSDIGGEIKLDIDF